MKEQNRPNNSANHSADDSATDKKSSVHNPASSKSTPLTTEYTEERRGKGQATSGCSANILSPNDRPSRVIRAERRSARTYTKEQLIAAIKECVAELGRVPRRGELREAKGITQKMIERNFRTYKEAFEAAGFEIRGAGYKLTRDQIFIDFASVVRKIGRVPSVVEFQMHSQKSGVRAYRVGFGSWLKVPKGLLEYAESRGLAGEWSDVLEIMREHCRRELVTEMKAKAITESTQMPRINEEWPLYGAPLARPDLPMVYAPRNEAGVLVLFGALAMRLGFMILWVGTAFPDVEAIREVQPGLWQRKRIEIEFQSRNFMGHGHHPDGCDLIVCWEDNWRESPVEVLELRKAIRSGDPVIG